MEYTVRAEYLFGHLFVTREITDITAPFTKWDLLSDNEKQTLLKTPFEDGLSSCSQCNIPLATEADFAKHFIISDVRYFNLGDCPNNRMGIYQGELE